MERRAPNTWVQLRVKPFWEMVVDGFTEDMWIQQLHTTHSTCDVRHHAEPAVQRPRRTVPIYHHYLTHWIRKKYFHCSFYEKCPFRCASKTTSPLSTKLFFSINVSFLETVVFPLVSFIIANPNCAISWPIETQLLLCTKNKTRLTFDKRDYPLNF